LGSRFLNHQPYDTPPKIDITTEKKHNEDVSPIIKINRRVHAHPFKKKKSKQTHELFSKTLDKNLTSRPKAARQCDVQPKIRKSKNDGFGDLLAGSSQDWIQW